MFLGSPGVQKHLQKGVKVLLNGSRLPCRSFKDYVEVRFKTPKHSAPYMSHEHLCTLLCSLLTFAKSSGVSISEMFCPCVVER